MESPAVSGEVHGVKVNFCRIANYRVRWKKHPATKLWVSNTGLIKRKRNDFSRYGYRFGDKNGYIRYKFKGKTYYSHFLVLETWWPELKPKEGRAMAVWLDGNTWNNVADNLRWKVPKRKTEKTNKGTGPGL